MSFRTESRSCFTRALLIAMVTVSVSTIAQITPTSRVNYQGVLRNAAGSPINGPVTVTFRFYDHPTAGSTLLWEEMYDPSLHPPQLTVSGGLFTVALGDPAHRSSGSQTDFANVFALYAPVYLAVKVGADAEMTPRIQAAAAPYCENADTLDGKHASSFIDASFSGTFLNTSSTAQTKAAKLTLTSAIDYGIEAHGPWAGGYFVGSTGSGYANVGTGDFGIQGYGNSMGGYFQDLDSTGRAYLGAGDYGIQAVGDFVGGYFNDQYDSGYAYVGYGNLGIDAYGSQSGGYFHGSLSGHAYVGYGDRGIWGKGTFAGATFSHPDNVTFWADVATPTYKIRGTGTVSFVQNHPRDANKVIVYAAPEGDEVATYTRGTARLVQGEARVKLGETFAWVTNPDLGLTAHLTPRGSAVPLAIRALSTAELVVTGPEDVAFDYLVYGLRIGFEDSAIVQPKEREAMLPSDQAFAVQYGDQLQLRAFNAKERFKAMEISSPAVAPEVSGTPGADALKAAIQAAGYQGIGKAASGEIPASLLSLQAPAPLQPPLSPASVVHPPMPLRDRPESPPTEEFPEISPPSAVPDALCLPVSGSVQAGDVVVMDPARDGMLLACSTIADPLVVGIAMGSRDDCLTQRQSGEAPSAGRVPVATSGIVLCKVDAGFAPIRRGDLLVASPLQGHAMRADHPVQGTVIGKALEPLDAGTGTIRVLIMLR